MAARIFAIATCRVSSDEQLLNNSLSRQRQQVLKAAEELSVEIPDDGWWSGSVSSKKGTDVDRTDLQEMLARCTKDKRIKYLIVDEPDRFMRSIDEAAYFEVSFRRLGVTVWYASDPELNNGDLAAKLLKFTKYLSAEGSNEERQRKSIAGQTTALMEGRYPFAPKPGYKKGNEKGVQEVNPVQGPALRAVLTRLASRLITPTQALADLNSSDFTKGHSAYKMDKFRQIATDPFYAGILEVNKQVKVRNENGLHEPLITKTQHNTLVAIFNTKAKNQAGPRKKGNPRYPGNNITVCEHCLDANNGRFVGFKHSNGKPNGPIYEKYRCRACNLYITRVDMHAGIEKQFKDYPITNEGVEDLLEALRVVWKQREGEAEQEAYRIKHQIQILAGSIRDQIEAVTDPTNSTIKQEILDTIERKKSDKSILEEKLETLHSNSEADREQFLRFAFDFARRMSSWFTDGSISQENTLRCKQVMFPAGFYVDKNKRVYTPEKSYLITLLPSKKSTGVLSNSQLVRLTGHVSNGALRRHS